jgi:hypothetical protein
MSQTKHGSPADRGAADSWYRRPKDPHYWPEGTYNGTRVERAQMTRAQIAAYTRAYNANEKLNNHKDY